MQSFMSEGAWDLAYCIQQSIPQSFTGFCKLIADHPKTWERYSMRDDEDYIDGMPCGIGMD